MNRRTLLLLLSVMLPVSTVSAEDKERLAAHAETIAKQVESALENNLLSEAQIYSYLTLMVTHDELVYGSALAFNPEFLQGHTFFLQDNITEDGRILYSPYVHRDKERLLRAFDIGNIGKEHGYDYTTWDWFKAPLSEQKPHWTEPYFDKGGGEINMVTYSIPIGEKAILTFDMRVDGE
ncbi:MAG: cache domain-containing protein [Verrucomicrobiota bacterium]